MYHIEEYAYITGNGKTGDVMEIAYVDIHDALAAFDVCCDGIKNKWVNAYADWDGVEPDEMVYFVELFNGEGHQIADMCYGYSDYKEGN